MLRAATVATLVALAPPGAAQTARAPFQRSFSGAINNLGVITSGVAWADYDGDGDLDLFASAFENENNILFENLGGRKFRRVDARPVTGDAGNSSGAAWADFDNDGRPDLAVANQAGQDNFLYRNLGGGRFERVEGPVTQDRGDSYSVSWADYDGDGLLDLFVSNMGGPRDFLYHNLGAGKFARVDSGVFAARRGASFTSTWGDYDGDGRVDLFVADAGRSTPNRLYHNLGGGRFELVTDGALGVDVAQSKGAAWGDFDNDGDLDLYVANGGFEDDGRQTAFLYRNDGGHLTRITTGPVVTEVERFRRRKPSRSANRAAGELAARAAPRNRASSAPISVSSVTIAFARRATSAPSSSTAPSGWSRADTRWVPSSDSITRARS